MSKEHGPHQKCSKDIEAWELEMASAVVRAFRTQDPEELHAVLLHKLFMLKRQANPAIRNWKAYLAKFYYNKAANWVRDERARERRHQSSNSSADIGDGLSVRQGDGDDPETPAAVTAVRRELRPELQVLWDTIVQENGNQTRAAKIVGIHRNTARLWVLEIREILRRHGF